MWVHESAKYLYYFLFGYLPFFLVFVLENVPVDEERNKLLVGATVVNMTIDMP